MKRLFVILIIVTSAASVATAQQSSQSKDRFAQIKARLSPASNEAVEVEAPFYVRDGKVYVSFASLGVMMPMTGGGAGMCFSIDLKNRIDALKNLILRFPK